MPAINVKAGSLQECGTLTRCVKFDMPKHWGENQRNCSATKITITITPETAVRQDKGLKQWLLKSLASNRFKKTVCRDSQLSG